LWLKSGGGEGEFLCLSVFPLPLRVDRMTDLEIFFGVLLDVDRSDGSCLLAGSSRNCSCNACGISERTQGVRDNNRQTGSKLDASRLL
jgi:hypothetical protein